MTDQHAGGEMVDVVDEHDRVLDTVPRSTMRAGNLRHRAVYLVVMSDEGRVLVHRRSEAKDVWPGRWDLAAGGVVLAGETYEVAAARELAEELGIDADLTELGPSSYEDGDVRVVGRVFVCRHNGPFVFADGEVVEAKLVDRATLDAMLRSEAWCPDTLVAVPPHLQGLLT